MQLNDTVNLDGLKQEIYFNGKITANTIPQNDLNRIINKYYAIAQSIIRGVNEDFYIEIATTDLLINTGGTYPNEYLIDSQYEKIKQVQVAFNPKDPTNPLATEYEVCRVITQDQITDPSYVFSGPTVVIFDNSFMIWPLVTVQVTRGIKLWEVIKQPKLVLDTDVPNIFTDYQDVITWGSLIDIGFRLTNQLLLAEAKDMWKDRKEDMKTYASSRSLSLASELTEGQPPLDWNYRHGRTPMS